MKKSLWIIAFLIIVITGCANYPQETEKTQIQEIQKTPENINVGKNSNSEDQNIQECIKKKFIELKDRQYASGRILVSYQENTKEKVTDIVDAYGLEVEDKGWTFNAFIVKVPNNEEIKWICKLMVHKEIISVDVDGLNQYANLPSP